MRILNLRIRRIRLKGLNVNKKIWTSKRRIELKGRIKKKSNYNSKIRMNRKQKLNNLNKSKNNNNKLIKRSSTLNLENFISLLEILTIKINANSSFPCVPLTIPSSKTNSKSNLSQEHSKKEKQLAI